MTTSQDKPVEQGGNLGLYKDYNRVLFRTPWLVIFFYRKTRQKV